MSAEKQEVGTKNWNKTHSGFVGDLSEEQAASLAELRKAITDKELDELKWPHETYDSVSCRFLRARKFEVAPTIEMMRNALEWRRTFKPHELIKRPAAEVLGMDPDEMAFFYPHTYIPLGSKSGNPVYFERTGHIDIDGLLMQADFDHLLDYHVYSMETNLVQQFVTATERSGRVIDQAINVLDLAGLSSKQLNGTTQEYLKRLGKLASDYYPEMMKKMIVINAPTLFTVAWKVIKTFVDEGTRQKIEIYGSESSWKPRLAELIGTENLPEEYGGKYKFTGGRMFLPSRTNKIKISSGKKDSYDVPVQKGQEIAFKWFARPGDIKFGVMFTPAAGGKRIELLPSKAYPDSGKTIVVERITAPDDGTMNAEFDNSAAWRERRVYKRWDLVGGPGYVAPTAPGQAKEEGGEAPVAVAGGGGGGDE